MHSSKFRSRDQFGVDTTVIILGSGETAADLAYFAATSPTKRFVMCHRDGFILAPKTNPMTSIMGTTPREKSDPPPTPNDVSRASLFDTAYVHTWLRKSMALWTYYDYYIGWSFWVSCGTTHGLDQWIRAKPQGWSTSQIFFNKSPKVAPYINNPQKPKRPLSLLQYVRSLLVRTNIFDTKDRLVELAPWPEHIDEHRQVAFKNNGRPKYFRVKDDSIQPDLVIFCTGYSRSFPFLSTSTSETNVRNLWNQEDPSLGFIGFVRPPLGAIPPLSELQAQLWILNLLAPELDPNDEPHYRLRTTEDARVKCGVDHESYAYQLVLDMKSAPSFLEVLCIGLKGPRRRLWRLPLVWALGANFDTKFHLRGPWKWPDAAEVLTEELWETITRRPMFFGHFTLSITPMLIFGFLSLVLFILEGISDGLQRIGGTGLAVSHRALGDDERNAA